MLESDALPLCYRAVLYGVYRYLIFFQLSIPQYRGNLWVWSVRERARVCGETTVCAVDRLMYSLYSFMRYYLPS